MEINTLTKSFFAILCMICMFILFGMIFLLLYTPIPIDKEPTLVTTKDNCSVYKYYDKGDKIYFTTCDEK